MWTEVPPRPGDTVAIDGGAHDAEIRMGDHSSTDHFGRVFDVGYCQIIYIFFNKIMEVISNENSRSLRIVGPMP